MRLRLILFFFVSFFMVSNLFGIDRKPADSTKAEAVAEEEIIPIQFFPYAQVSFGLTSRTDDKKFIDHGLAFKSQLFYYVSPEVAAKFGLGYKFDSEFKQILDYGGVSYNYIVIETGFRFRLSQAKISPYVDGGFEIGQYRSDILDINSTRLGFNIGTGFMIKLSPSIHLDFNLVQTINHVNYNRTILDSPLYLPSFDDQPFMVGLYNEAFDDAVYNPSRFSVFLLFTL